MELTLPCYIIRWPKALNPEEITICYNSTKEVIQTLESELNTVVQNEFYELYKLNQDLTLTKLELAIELREVK